MNAKALLLVLFAALGVVCWFLLKGGVDLEPGHTAPAETPAVAGSNAAPQTHGVERAAAASETAGPDRTAAPAAAGNGDRGPAMVRGRIVDGSGSPRGSVELVLNSWNRVDGFGDIDIGDLPSPGGQQRAGREPKPTCTTRADGTFHFPLAAERDARLELATDHLVFSSRVPQIKGSKADQDLGDLAVVKEGMLRGVVQDEHGKPIADVNVNVGAGELGFAGFGALSSAKTGADGKFSLGMLRPGRWTLRTASGQFLPTVQEFTLAPEEQRDTVVVVRPGQAIAGQVVDERGVGVSGCKVGSKRKESRGGVAIERFATDESATTDAGGFFTLSGLSTETATVRTFDAGHTSATAADVPVGTGNLVLRVERLGSVEGVLVGADGTPVEGSRVVARPKGQGPGDVMFEPGEDLPLARGNGGGTTAADGTFRVEGVRPGMVTVAATGEGHLPVQKADVQVLPAQTVKGVRLVADLGAMARVTVVDEGGAPVAGAKVQAKRPAEGGAPGNGTGFRARRVGVSNDNGDVHVGAGPEGLGTATTNAEGVALLTGLPAGEVQLVATHAEFAPAKAARATLPKSGTVDAGLTLRKPGFAEVLVTGADGAQASGVSFRVSGPVSEDSRDVSGKTNDAGLGVVGPLAAGNYTVVLLRPGNTARVGDMAFMSFGQDDAIESTQQPFAVKAGETTRIELSKPALTKVYGTVTGIDGPIAGCTVELEQHGSTGIGLPGMGGGRSTKTAADGSFAIEDVESGRYTARYGKPEQVVKATADFEVPPNQPELRQDLVLRTGKLRVQACAKDTGEAVSGAEVEIARASAGAAGQRPRQQRMVMMVSVNGPNAGGETTTMTMGSQRAQTGADGWAEVEDVPAGEYTVRVTHKKYAPVELKGQTVVEQRTTDCGRVEMGPAGRIRGTVVARDGKSVQVALVQHRAAGVTAWSEPTVAMGGSFRIDGLAAGKYSVRAQLISENTSYGPEVEVEVKGGETTTTEVQPPEK
jgi:hypothetical protein